MKEYYTIENLSPAQLDELRAVYFWADDTDPETLDGIADPAAVPNWLLFREYAGIMFTDDDFFCTAGK